MPDHFSAMKAAQTPRPHNACDECRTRKLKCSGEPTGCARCVQDGVACRYSPRKQMGRPRKRRREEEAELQSSQFDPWGFTNGMDGLGATSGQQENSMAFPDMVDAQLGMNGFSDMNGVGLDPSIFDLSSSNGGTPYANGTLDSTGSLGSSNNDFMSHNLPETQYQPCKNMDFAGWMPSPNIDQPLSRPHHASQTQTPAPSEHRTPSDTTASSSAPNGCSCITTLYSTLSSFSSTPEAFFPYGISRLKHNTSIARKALNCDICAQSYTTAVQNGSALNTLINLIIAEYAKILKEIDERSKTQDKIQFRIGETGTPETMRLHSGTPDCPMGITIDLTGAEWRTLARNAVRKEIFGDHAGDECLAKLVEARRERQVRWHNKFSMEQGRTEHAMHDEQGAGKSFECTGVLYIKRLREMLDGLGLQI